jgi:type IV secretory pathway protease TraF
VNKPFLPVAAGEISKPLAWTLVAGTGVAGLALVYSTFSPVAFPAVGLYRVPSSAPPKTGSIRLLCAPRITREAAR